MSDYNPRFEDRPSYQLYARDAALNREDFETVYELAYEMGRLDVVDGLTAASDRADWPWYPDDDYSEGYGDGWNDHYRAHA